MTPRARHSRVTYHFDEACQSVLAQGETVSLEELQKRLKDRYGLKPRATTIAKVNREIEVEQGIAPLKVSYELNPEYFSTVGKHRPNTPRSWKRYMQSGQEIDSQHLNIDGT